jgi:hypothetical protein
MPCATSAPTGTGIDEDECRHRTASLGGVKESGSGSGAARSSDKARSSRGGVHAAASQSGHQVPSPRSATVPGPEHHGPFRIKKIS